MTATAANRSFTMMAGGKQRHESLHQRMAKGLNEELMISTASFSTRRTMCLGVLAACQQPPCTRQAGTIRPLESRHWIWSTSGAGAGASAGISGAAGGRCGSCSTVDVPTLAPTRAPPTPVDAPTPAPPTTCPRWLTPTPTPTGPAPALTPALTPPLPTPTPTDTGPAGMPMPTPPPTAPQPASKAASARAIATRGIAWDKVSMARLCAVLLTPAAHSPA